MNNAQEIPRVLEDFVPRTGEKDQIYIYYTTTVQSKRIKCLGINLSKE